MASRIKTYFQPKVSSVFSGWSPELSDQSVDDWYAENMPWLATEEQRKAQYGFTAPWNEPERAVDERTLRMKLNLDPTPEELEPTGMTKEQKKLQEELQERERDAAKSGFVEGAAKGATAGATIGTASPIGPLGGVVGGVVGGVLGGGLGAGIGGYQTQETFAEGKIAEERREELEGYASDAARLAAEAAAAEQRLGLPTTGGLTDQQALAQSYSAPTSYDNWYQSIFSA